MSRLAICAIFKNEAAFLLEWIAYHRIVGFDHFYLYDNDSTDGGADLIRQSNLARYVTVTQWPQRPGQLPAYRDFIDHHAQGFDWAAFIDLDEFLLPLEGRSVRPILESLGTASAVLVHWRVFGPSGWDERPAGLAIDNYTKRAADSFQSNRHIKSVVRCADLIDVSGNPHQFLLRGEPCDALGRTIPNDPIQKSSCHERLVINHYQTRSRQDWLAKLRRGHATTEQADQAYPSHLIDYFDEVSIVVDETIRSFSAEVKALLTDVPTDEPQEPEFPPSPSSPSPPSPSLADEPVWMRQGNTAWRHRDGLALVYRDNGRPGLPWLGALCHTAAGLVDPTFLTDPYGHIRTFPSDQDAIAACESVLEGTVGKETEAAKVP